MDLGKVKYLAEAYSAESAEKLIADGWALLSVVPLNEKIVYVLGKPEERKPMNISAEVLRKAQEDCM